MMTRKRGKRSTEKRLLELYREEQPLWLHWVLLSDRDPKRQQIEERLEEIRRVRLDLDA